MRKAIVVLIGCLVALLPAAHGHACAESPEVQALARIARGIEGLKATYPQLAGFSPANVDAATLTISYAHRTHRAQHAGGWTSGVPNPDDDGLWFHIDLHDPGSTAQIHTQPMTGTAQCLGDKRVGFLILEGAKTASVNAALWEVLREAGVKECRPKPD
jgi:hypothetical protein